MIARERLYLDSSRTRVVRAEDKGPKTLLVCAGGEVPKEFVQLVEDFYAKPSATESPPEKHSDPIEDLETRVPPVLTHRSGRGRKKHNH